MALKMMASISWSLEGTSFPPDFSSSLWAICNTTSICQWNWLQCYHMYRFHRFVWNFQKKNVNRIRQPYRLSSKTLYVDIFRPYRTDFWNWNVKTLLRSFIMREWKLRSVHLLWQCSHSKIQGTATCNPITHWDSISSRNRTSSHSLQVRSGVGAYAGAARRRIHLATVFLRPPFGHRPGRRQARHARILHIGLHLTQSWSLWMPLRHGPAPRIWTRKGQWAGSS